MPTLNPEDIASLFENNFPLWDQERSTPPTTLTYTFLTSLPDYYGSAFYQIDISLNFNASTVAALSVPQQLALHGLLDAALPNSYRASFSDVANVSFIETAYAGDDIGQSGDITYSQAVLTGGTGDEHGYEYSVDDARTDFLELKMDKSGVVINSASSAMNDLGVGQTGLHILLHETAHSLGLQDFKDTDYLDTGYDNQKYSVMSYHAYRELSSTSLQLFDILALQEIYGRNYGMREDDTSYSKLNVLCDASNPSTNPHGAVVYSIWDGDGVDEIDASGFSERVQIDLRQGKFSSIGYYKDGNPVMFDNHQGPETGSDVDPNNPIPDNNDHGNISIAFYTVIENAIGTDDVLGDILIGNAWDNVLRGLGGNDYIYGDGITYDQDAGFLGVSNGNGGFYDPNRAWSVDNAVYAANLSGNDTLYGDAGQDHLFGGAGDDIIDGGADHDTYYYSLGDGNDHWYDDGWDTENSIVFGGGLTWGDVTATIDGTTRILNFSDGATVYLHNYYAEQHPSQIIWEFDQPRRAVNFVTYQAYQYQGFTGQEISITGPNQTLSGNAQSNVIFAGSGATVFAGGGHDLIYFDEYDLIYGGDGNDKIITQGREIYGTEENASTIYGGNGDDMVVAGHGTSYIYGGDGNDTLYGGWVRDDQFERWLDKDVIHGDDGDDYIWGGWSYYDVIYGDDGNDTLILWPSQEGHGGAGNDFLRIEYRELWLIQDHSSVYAYGDSGDDVYAIDNMEWLFQWSREVVIGDTSGEDYIIFAMYENTINSMHVDNYDLVIKFSTFDWDAMDSTESSIRILNYFDGEGDNKIEWIQFWVDDLDSEDYVDFKALVDTWLPEAPLYGSSGEDTLQGNGYNNLIEGRGGNDTLSGGGGNDQIFGGDGDDELNGDDGDDVIVGGSGNNTINGGDGIDTVSYTTTLDAITVNLSFNSAFVGSSVDNIYGIEYVIGSDFSDHITGDVQDNALNGNRGGDVLIGLGGIDELNGGDDDDIIYGDDTARLSDYIGAGDDTINAGAGSDNAYGGAGNDTIYGDDGDDELYGDTGNDYLLGGVGNDTLYGGTDDDTLDGGEGSDILIGEAGNDALVGWDGDDVIYGDNITRNANYVGAGADFISGGAGNDSLYGGAGDDTIYGDEDDDDLYGDSGNDSLYGGSGNDLLNGGTGNDMLSGEDGDDDISGGDGDDTLYGFFGDDILRGHNGNDILEGEFGNDRLYGHAGADILNGGDDNDILYGGDDNDTLNGGSGNDVLNGDAGDDFLDGSDGDDTLRGGIGRDILLGSFGIDRLYGNEDDDELSGGHDDDYLYGDAGSDLLHGDDGNDRLFGGTENDYLYGGVGDDILRGQEGNDDLYGEDGNDTLFGDEELAAGNDDRLYGGDGDDRLYGYGGSDTLRGDDGEDRLYGGEGNDTLYGGNHRDYLYGGTGNDTLNGEAGDDYLRGEDGNDILSGGDGDDDLYGDAGNDIISGGNGYDYLDGGDGSDSLNGGAQDDTLRGRAGDDSLIGGQGIDRLYGDDGFDFLSGGNDDDLLWGGNDDDVLYGDFGNDILRGEAGNDSLNGGFEDDRLFGGDGNDILNGGQGLDRLYGESGSDTFYYGYDSYEPGVMDYIYDFTAGLGADTLNFAEILDYDSTLGHLLGDFVQLQDIGGGVHTRVRVDIDGAGTDHAWTNLTQLQNVTGLNLTDLVTNGNLIAE